MLNNKDNNQNREKFLCFCSKVTHKSFYKELSYSNFNNLEDVCERLGLAKSCASCLPNIEDEFFKNSGKKHTITNQLFKENKITIKKKIRNFLDSLFGNKYLNLDGNLPMLASNKVKTWLVLSNHSPNIIKNVTVPYKLNVIIYNNLGKKINFLRREIKKNSNIKICLNNFIPKCDNHLQTFFVKVTRSATKDGFRGSTRTHFYYEAQNSMSTLHTQDGQQKKTSLDLTISKNNDKNFVFMINTLNKSAKINVKMSSLNNFKIKKINKKSLSIPPRGSILTELNGLIDYDFKNHFFECTASNPIKCYFIISDKNFQKISVDHL